jgi:hypothetical protein
MADRSEILDSGFFEVRKIIAVVNDAHGIGFGKANPNVM